jgi:hypothetical protein
MMQRKQKILQKRMTPLSTSDKENEAISSQSQQVVAAVPYLYLEEIFMQKYGTRLHTIQEAETVYEGTNWFPDSSY